MALSLYDCTHSVATYVHTCMTVPRRRCRVTCRVVSCEKTQQLRGDNSAAPHLFLPLPPQVHPRESVFTRTRTSLPFLTLSPSGALFQSTPVGASAGHHVWNLRLSWVSWSSPPAGAVVLCVGGLVRAMLLPKAPVLNSNFDIASWS